MFFILKYESQLRVLAGHTLGSPLVNMPLVINVYVLQVGCTENEKILFWQDIDEITKEVPEIKKIIIISKFK